MSLNMKEKMLKNFIENNLNDIYGISYAALYQFVDIGIINSFKFKDLRLETKTSYFEFFLSNVEIFDLDNSA